jgi:radial spoke head protein 9
MAFIDISDLSHFSLAGFSLNTEEKTVITTSLRIKAEEEKLTSVSLWGKINGVQRDYFIAQAPVQDNAFARKFFYR